MARPKQNLAEDLIEVTSKLPWWFGVALAIAAYLWLHGVATSEVTAVVKSGKMGDFIGQSVFKTLASVGQYLLPFVFSLAEVKGLLDRALNDTFWQLPT